MMAYFVLGSAAYMYIYISRLHPNHIEHCSVFHKSSRIASPMRMRMRTPCAGSWLVFSSGLFLSRSLRPPRRGGASPKPRPFLAVRRIRNPSVSPPDILRPNGTAKSQFIFSKHGPLFPNVPSIHPFDFFPPPIPSQVFIRRGHVPCRRRRLPPLRP